jgi:hypothetical protein
MRDPSLVEPRSANVLRVKPPHGRQTRVALGLETNGEHPGNANASSRSHTPGQTGGYRVVYTGDADADGQENQIAATRQNGIAPPRSPGTGQPSSLSTPGRPRPLQRARSDFGPRHRGERNAAVVEEDLWHMRHGWEDEYTSNEYLALLNSVSCQIVSKTRVC